MRAPNGAQIALCACIWDPDRYLLGQSLLLMGCLPDGRLASRGEGTDGKFVGIPGSDGLHEGVTEVVNLQAVLCHGARLPLQRSLIVFNGRPGCRVLHLVQMAHCRSES